MHIITICDCSVILKPHQYCFNVKNVKKQLCVSPINYQLINQLIIFLFVFLTCATLHADEQSFNLGAYVPAKAGIMVSAARGENVDVLPASSSLDFGALQFDASSNIYKSSNTFVISITPIGWVGSIDATLTYAESRNPNGLTGKGLGWHVVAWFKRFVYRGNQSITIDLPDHGPRKLLKDVVNEHVTPEEMGSGTALIVHLQLASGDATDPADAVPFSLSDVAGDYEGVLTITAAAR